MSVKVVLIRKEVDVLEKLMFGNANKRILDPTFVSPGQCRLVISSTDSPVVFSVNTATL